MDWRRDAILGVIGFTIRFTISGVLGVLLMHWTNTKFFLIVCFALLCEIAAWKPARQPRG